MLALIVPDWVRTIGVPVHSWEVAEGSAPSVVNRISPRGRMSRPINGELIVTVVDLIKSLALAFRTGNVASQTCRIIAHGNRVAEFITRAASIPPETRAIQALAVPPSVHPPVLSEKVPP